MSEQSPISMELEPGFLERSTCCGYEVDARQKRVFAVQLDLLKKFLEVCDKHGIKAVAFAGTLLGAIRHKGFIPWDDDAAVCMDRENFERLIRLPGETFPAPYFLQTCFSDRRFFCPYARLRNSLTTGAIVGEDYPDYNNGIYIDIFVLDGYSNCRPLLFLQKKLRSMCLEGISSLGGLSYERKSFLARCTWALKPIWRLVGFDRLVVLYNSILSFATPMSERLSMITHSQRFISRYWFYKSELHDVVMLPFENIKVPVPRNYDAVLRRMYGNYMEFPPVEERGKWHWNQILVDPDVPYVEYLTSNTSMRKAWFVTFADSRMKQPLRRITTQAKEIGFSPDRILAMTERDLSAEFTTAMQNHLVKGSRGYGYWCWRPEVVLRALSKMNDGEIMLYADAGCHLNLRGLPRLREYLKIVDESEMLAFQARSLLGTAQYDPKHHFNPIWQWTKGDVIDYFGARDCREILSSGQYSGGVFLVKKTPRTVAFYEKYLSIALAHFNFFDDSPSATPNLPGFREHRHDQAVFTLLCKQSGVKTLSVCEYGVYVKHAPECYRGNRAWSRASFDDMEEFPVHARRDTTHGFKAYIPRKIRRFLLAMQSAMKKGWRKADANH